MKKAKIMLMAIAVLAVAGGALAFKAKAFSPYKVFSCVDGGAGVGKTCVEDIPATFGLNAYTPTATIEIAIAPGTPCNQAQCTFDISTNVEE